MFLKNGNLCTEMDKPLPVCQLTGGSTVAARTWAEI